MKKNTLVVLTLLALIPFGQIMAQAPAKAAEAPAADGLPAPTLDVEPFLASPSCEQPAAPSEHAPASSSLIICTSSSECPTGQLCCNICGALPDDDPSSCMRCVEPVRKRCPLVV